MITERTMIYFNVNDMTGKFFTDQYYCKSIRDLELPLLNVYFFTDGFFSLQISVRLFFVIIVLVLSPPYHHNYERDNDLFPYLKHN